MSRYDITQAYMMTWDIPYYLRYFGRGLSLAQNVDAMFFEDRAPLKDEFDSLFSSLFSNPGVMATIAKALNTKDRGADEDGAARSDRDCLQRRVLPPPEGVRHGCLRDQVHLVRQREEGGVLRAHGHFCLFWLRFVRQSQAGTTNWVNIANTGAVVAWRWHAFENICWNRADKGRAGHQRGLDERVTLVEEG